MNWTAPCLRWKVQRPMDGSAPHAILIATLAKLGHVVWSVEEAIRKAFELLGKGWSNDE